MTLETKSTLLLHLRLVLGVLTPNGCFGSQALLWAYDYVVESSDNLILLIALVPSVCTEFVQSTHYSYSQISSVFSQIELLEP